jgi:hypothetical protein
MCNLYSMRKSRDELVKLFGITRVGNVVQFDFPSIYPDAWHLWSRRRKAAFVL